MSAFEQAKETMMLLITLFVITWVSVMFYIFLGNFRIGSEVDVRYKEGELVTLRTLKCLENNEKLSECLKTNRYGIKIKFKDSDKTIYNNEKLYNSLEDDFIYSEACILRNKFCKIFVRFKNE